MAKLAFPAWSSLGAGGVRHFLDSGKIAHIDTSVCTAAERVRRASRQAQACLRLLSAVVLGNHNNIPGRDERCGQPARGATGESTEECANYWSIVLLSKFGQYCKGSSVSLLNNMYGILPL